MKHPASIYVNFSNFFSLALEIAKDKVGLFNSLVAPPARKKIEGNSFQQFLNVVIYIIAKAGWYTYVAIGGLIALGVFAFYGGVATLLATNPLLAAALVLAGGGSIRLLWKHSGFVLSSKKVGERYKVDFDMIVESHERSDDREAQINALLKNCVISLCVECFTANTEAFKNKMEKEDI